jgi:hypothetical protein
VKSTAAKHIMGIGYDINRHTLVVDANGIITIIAVVIIIKI